MRACAKRRRDDTALELQRFYKNVLALAVLGAAAHDAGAVENGDAWDFGGVHKGTAAAHGRLDPWARWRGY